MERKNKACWNCGNYKAYYTKGLCHFDKLNCGLCRKRKETVEKHSLCEFWRSDYKVRRFREDVAKRKLSDILDILIEIRQILFEEKESDSENRKQH